MQAVTWIITQAIQRVAPQGESVLRVQEPRKEQLVKETYSRSFRLDTGSRPRIEHIVGMGNADDTLLPAGRAYEQQLHANLRHEATRTPAAAEELEELIEGKAHALG